MVTPTEISRVLLAHPGVRRAETATLRHDGKDITIAAVELTDYLGGPVLRDYVRQQLGEDSGLTGVLTVESIPMKDGSVDVAQLASAVDDGRCVLFESPRDDVERKLVTIWSEQMRLDAGSVGANDDFLELGGDSLSALGVIAAIESEFDRSLDVFEFMSASSVRRVADILR
ncbi:acyl carrier protein [Actinophytocola oryzae]|uniref:Acyl carrier protein n=1 Tax=Actinophytocola oryzae TaxID=502181 RepID=A0A4R7VJT4_9PSEU|nr:phosphopantetheine-binding protein [Actinophytocola oryzae]TDV49710.1 acyl carrier protein [Actinophytocola oryzae]